MTAEIPEDRRAYDDLFGLEVDEQYVGHELSDAEVEELLNG